MAYCHIRKEMATRTGCDLSHTSRPAGHLLAVPDRIGYWLNPQAQHQHEPVQQHSRIMANLYQKHEAQGVANGRECVHGLAISTRTLPLSCSL
eukprot:4227153-Amphidinium_carterae.1